MAKQARAWKRGGDEGTMSRCLALHPRRGVTARPATPQCHLGCMAWVHHTPKCTAGVTHSQRHTCLIKNTPKASDKPSPLFLAANLPSRQLLPPVLPCTSEYNVGRTVAHLLGWRAFLSLTPNPSNTRTSHPSEPWRNTKEKQARESAGR